MIGIAKDAPMNFPYFKKNTMYKGIKINKNYTLKELRTGGKSMREIEFRGKRLDNEEWVYGWLRQTGHQNIEKPNGQYIRTEKYYQIQDKEYNSYFVDPKTIGQYTGLKDKKRKKDI